MNEFVKNIREASDESADEIIEQIKASHKVSRVIGWPGHEDIKVEMRLLNMSECRQAKIDNQLEFKKAGIELSVANLADYREQEVVHGLWRACYNPATGERIFRNAEDLRKSCTPDELLYLSGEFNSFVEEQDPNINKLSDKDFESLKELLKKTPDQIQLKVTNLPLAWRLLHTLVAQQPK